KGTGLGLAMVYGFIKQSAGHVSVYSELGHGTTVKLYLPRASAAEQANVAAAEQPADALPVGGTGTILLDEDDVAVRQGAWAQLLALGYTVLEASDGPSAMAILRQRQDIDLLFTDVVMPGGMNGRALADAARQLHPHLHVLYTSGYTENAIVHHGRLDEGARLLGKPYRRGDLDRAVREALADPPAAPSA
ncbi:MAG: response regulator, partial [Rubrivivax sp.]|nr:response regulator [Rubrivivax sp.]